LTAEDEIGEHQSDTSMGLAGLSVAALGVVFGDIGTSPVYTFRECFNPGFSELFLDCTRQNR
jgi:K+ transporter